MLSMGMPRKPVVVAARALLDVFLKISSVCQAGLLVLQ